MFPAYHERIMQVLESIEDVDVQKHLTKVFRENLGDIELRLIYWAPEIKEQKYGTTVYNSFVAALKNYQRKTRNGDVPEQYRPALMNAVEDKNDQE